MSEEPKKTVSINYNYLIAIGVSVLIGWLAKQGVTPAPIPVIPPELITGMVEQQKATTDTLKLLSESLKQTQAANRTVAR